MSLVPLVSCARKLTVSVPFDIGVTNAERVQIPQTWKSAEGAKSAMRGRQDEQCVMVLTADPTSIATSARATGVLVSQAIGAVLIDKHCPEALFCGELEEPVAFA